MNKDGNFAETHFRSYIKDIETAKNGLADALRRCIKRGYRIKWRVVNEGQPDMESHPATVVGIFDDFVTTTGGCSIGADLITHIEKSGVEPEAVKP